MKCAWQAYLNILPIWMREDVNKAGAERLQELRIRIGYPPQLIFKDTVYNLYRQASPQDITYIINIASEFSPWTAQTIRDGYITASGGHRIGICGLATFSDGIMKSISQPTSICIRVARDVEGIARPLSIIDESILLIGPPGSGKTTLLRDFIRCKSNMGIGSICVVDEREEIFPMHKGQACFSPGRNTDILSAADKICGINAVLRCMNPAWIAVDEITSREDCDALLHAGWCGVNLIATAHAGSITDLMNRPVYKQITEMKLFKNIIVLQKDQSWTLERL